MRFFLIFFSLIYSSLTQAQVLSSDGLVEPNNSHISHLPVIYGEDTRKDLFEVTNPLFITLADSIAAMMDPKVLIAEKPGFFRVDGLSFKESENLCSTERFKEQVVASHCSATLVSADMILTAAHCIATEAECKNVRFVFGYAIREPSTLSPLISASEVYQCSQILHSEFTEDGADFALIRLNRIVTNHKPLKMRETGVLPKNEELVILGFPSGLPLKIADGALVRREERDIYVATINSSGGNSGSGVFNKKTGLLEGVLDRGEEDFVEKGTCKISKICPKDDCSGEEVTKASKIFSSLPKSEI